MVYSGSSDKTSSYSSRIVIVSSLALSLLIYQFYSGGLVSFLLMKPPTTIRNLKDIDESGLEVGCEKVIYLQDFFNVGVRPGDNPEMQFLAVLDYHRQICVEALRKTCSKI